MKNIIKLIVISIIAVAGLVVVSPANQAHAWAVGGEANAVCDQGQAVITWSFTNDHKTGYIMPGTNLEEADMNVTATDQRTGQVYGPFVVSPQETITQTIETGTDKVEGNDIRFDMTWTHWNHKGFQDRERVETTMGYEDGKAIVELLTLAEYAEHWGWSTEELEQRFNRDAKITAYNTTETCEQPIEMCEVEGKEDLEANDPNCKVDEPKPEVEKCEIAGKTDLDADDPNCKEDTVVTRVVQETPKQEVLPNTGPAAVIAGFLGSGALGTTIRSWLISRKNLKNALTR